MSMHEIGCALSKMPTFTNDCKSLFTAYLTDPAQYYRRARYKSTKTFTGFFNLIKDDSGTFLIRTHILLYLLI